MNAVMKKSKNFNATEFSESSEFSISNETNVVRRWGATFSVLSGVGFGLPLIVYFFYLPAAGSHPTHSMNALSFLPWLAENGLVQSSKWWTSSLIFLLVLIGVPLPLLEKLGNTFLAKTAALVGILGLFSIILADLALAAGESLLGAAYVKAGPQAKEAIVAVFEWQRDVTALIFDTLGFGLMGAWVGLSSLAGLLSRRLSRTHAYLGLLTTFFSSCFALGYALRISWLGETGIGAFMFLLIPIWLVWLGVAFLRE